MPHAGVENALQNFGIMIPELVAGVRNTGGVPVFETDVESDGERFEHLQDWVRHRPEGIHGATGSAYVRETGGLGGTYRPQYALMDMRARQVFGNPFDSGVYDGRPFNRYRLVERGKPNPIETTTYFYGVEDDAIEMRRCFQAAWGITHERAGDVGGTLDTRVCRIFDLSEEMPGVVAQTEVQRIVAAAAGGATTVEHALGGAGTWTLTPGDNAAAVQTAARAGGMTGVVVAGTSVAASAGTPEVQTIVLAAVPTGPVYVLATPAVGNPSTVSFNSSSPTAAADLQTALEGVFGVGKVTVSGTLTASSGGDYSGTLTVTFSATLGNVTQLAAGAGQTGLTFDTTTPGVASSEGSVNLTFTFDGQEETDVAQMTVSGANSENYTVTTEVNGSDGTNYILPQNVYIEADHALVYWADDKDDLDSIDMANVPTDGSDGDPHLLLTAESVMWNIGNLADYHYVEDRRKFPHDFTQLVPEVTWSVRVQKDSDGEAMDLYNTATEDECVAAAKWFRIAYKCGGWEVWLDLYGARNDAPGTPVANNVAQREFSFERRANFVDYAAGWGSVVMTVIRPADEVTP